MTVNLKWPILLSVALSAGLMAACDPLMPDATPMVIVITQTPTQTRVPTATTVPPPTNATASAIGTPATPARTALACNESKGQVLNLTLDSKVESGPVRYRAYLPPCYNQTQRRYPYVILMPGSDQDETEWTAQLKAQDALDSGISVSALAPMILIMPNGGDLMNNNAFQDGASWESLVVTELIPEVERSFCTWNARQGRAIGGISRGGFWAFEIAFRHTDLFSAIGGHSPFFDPENAGPDYNPLGLAKTVQFASGSQPRIWLDVAQDDDARANVEIFERTLAGRNIDPGYTMNPSGGHEIPYWSSHVTEYLAFYGQTWPHDPLELPTCLQ